MAEQASSNASTEDEDRRRAACYKRLVQASETYWALFKRVIQLETCFWDPHLSSDDPLRLVAVKDVQVDTLERITTFEEEGVQINLEIHRIFERCEGSCLTLYIPFNRRGSPLVSLSANLSEASRIR